MTAMPLSHLLLGSAVLIGALMLVLWLASLRLRDSSIVDRFWGLGFVLVAAAAFPLAGGPLGRRVLLLALAATWGLRLAWHITRRNWGHGEDTRYQKMRASWGARFWWVSLLTVFALQGVLMWLVSLPLVVGQASPTPARLTWLDGLGALVWLVGFAFEAIGDAQLRAFKADPANRGRVMDRGLWRFTRHPNYFGDALLWWGIFLVASQAEHGPWTVVSPLIMTFLLTRISGVPMLERQLRKTRPGYDEYCRRTSAFFPWPPRRG
jgi:steroid 5-alpha reductase family enzyme